MQHHGGFEAHVFVMNKEARWCEAALQDLPFQQFVVDQLQSFPPNAWETDSRFSVSSFDAESVRDVLKCLKHHSLPKAPGLIGRAPTELLSRVHDAAVTLWTTRAWHLLSPQHVLGLHVKGSQCQYSYIQFLADGWQCPVSLDAELKQRRPSERGWCAINCYHSLDDAAAVQESLIPMRPVLQLEFLQPQECSPVTLDLAAQLDLQPTHTGALPQAVVLQRRGPLPVLAPPSVAELDWLLCALQALSYALQQRAIRALPSSSAKVARGDAVLHPFNLLMHVSNAANDLPAVRLWCPPTSKGKLRPAKRRRVATANDMDATGVAGKMAWPHKCTVGAREEEGDPDSRRPTLTVLDSTSSSDD